MTARCRHCDTPLESTLCDLGMSPLANSYLRDEDLDRAEKFYPLHAFVCSECLLVQLAEFESPEYIFSDYAYFSSFSQSWLEHAHTYVDSVVARFALGPQHQVVEIASNDGYLLQYFVALGIPVLGIEPAANVAVAAREKGIETLVEFFGTDIALEMVASGRQADLIIGNNVLAHVPALNDFVEGLSILLAPQGRITMEFPHLLQLMKHNQFDTIYHEHFSYFSFLTVSKVFARHGLRLFDVDQVPTHGGSLRIYGCHTDDTTHPQSGRVALLEADERAAGLDHLAGYSAFPEQVRRTKRALLRFLIDARDANKSVVAYGAPAKGNTLLNYCGVKTDLVDYTVDRSPHKQNHFLPGTHLPIYAPERIAETKPDYVLILPWNLKDEIMSEMTHVREWGGKFVVPIPEVTVVD
ncbi:MAG: methyltransferase domain-containing protein [Ilumatobacteraceae bacterium]